LGGRDVLTSSGCLGRQLPGMQASTESGLSNPEALMINKPWSQWDKDLKGWLGVLQLSGRGILVHLIY
jgi:hypothetical protein